MIRLFQIEWLKLRSYKIFWLLIVFYLLGMILVCSSVMLLFNFIKNHGGDFNGINPTIIPFYHFPDVWHNMTYLATFFKVLLAFIVIVSVTNEINYRTMRQNIIDGLSKKEFLLSKFLLILALSALTTIFLFIHGLVMGLIYSDEVKIDIIFNHMGFLYAYFLEVCTYLSLAFLLSVLIKKTGFIIILLFMYTLIFEPITTAILEHNYILPESIDWIIQIMPIKSLNNLVRVPYQKYVFMRIQDYVAWVDVWIVVGWLVVYNTLILLRLKSKNV